MSTRGTTARFVSTALGGLIAVSFVALSAGSVWIPPGDVLRVLAAHLTPFGDLPDAMVDAIVWNIRMPRLVVASVVGATLAGGASALQGTFRNPIVDGQLIGLSAISAIGALLGFWAGYATVGPEAAIVGGALVGAAGSWFVARTARHDDTGFGRLVLIGIAIGLSVSAMVATASIAIHDPRIPDVTFWFFGGLGTATWTTAAWVAALGGIGLITVAARSSRIDILGLGERAAQHVGVDVGVVVTTVTAIVGFGVGATVGAAGVIGFVGLVAARVVHHRVGPHHSTTIPVSIIVGAAFLVAADTIGRFFGHGFEVPVGLVTTILGGLYLARLVAVGRVGP
ncbi:MAG: iron ABC transporter permease [Acidimicrobiia bacterium]|nr:iron ABC transporter permease [Acidimicrobiia bacterium]